uniref:Uncharacterized protein n=1 Tax=Rhizophagus irregularis (strain DAOM 181602 / DAOM 197198 / MUCL 43194) TaxID=747089 RepID=U9T0N9_RHIID
MKRDLEEIIKPALQNPVEHKMTAHDWKKHDASHICDICVRLLQEYYDNETQKFNGAAHNGCVEEACSAKRLDFRKSILIVMKDEVSLYGMRIPFLDEFYSDDDLYYELPHFNKSVERSCLPKSNPVKTAMVHDSSSESSESSGGEFFDTVIPKKKQE